MAENSTTARLVMHMDMDAFFASVEQRDRPELLGKPVIVGAAPGSRGVVSTCSYEARRFGVHSAMPISEAYRRCPQGVYLPPDMSRYQEVSRQVMEVLGRFSPVVEPVSVDEAFVDLTGCTALWGEARHIGEKVKKTVETELRLTASVGIAPNRMAAKIASDLEKPDGLVIVAAEELLDFLAPLDVGKLRGVGAKGRDKLYSMGCRTVSDVRRCDETYLIRKLGEHFGRALFRQVWGRSSATVEQGVGRKSVSKEVTYQEDVTEEAILNRTLRDLSREVGRRLRKKGLKGHTATMKIRLKGFETHTRRKRLERPIDLDDEIFQAAWNLYEHCGFRHYAVRLIGLGVADLVTDEPEQLQLFPEDRPDPRREKLDRTLDSIEERFGLGSVHRAGSLKPKKK